MLFIYKKLKNSVKKSTFYIVGRHAVTEALKNPLRRVLRVFLTEDSKKRINRENQHLSLLKNVSLFYKTKKELDKYCSKDGITHQGLVAEIEHLEEVNIKDFVNKSSDRKYHPKHCRGTRAAVSARSPAAWARAHPM